MQNVAPTVADPEGLIPGWTSYRVHFTTSLGPKQNIGASNKFFLIDLEAEMLIGRKTKVTVND
jgi:hypothetical protein